MRIRGWKREKDMETAFLPSELLPKERIMKYYILINQKYGIDTEDGLRTYIHDMLDKAS